MSTNPIHGLPGQNDGQHDDDTNDAEVLDLAAARGRYSPDTDPDTSPDDDPDTEADEFAAEDPDTDHESLLIDIDAGAGAPVDPADEVPARLLGRTGVPVKPIVPDWARSRSDLYLTARWALKYSGYVVAYQVTRSPGHQNTRPRPRSTHLLAR